MIFLQGLFRIGTADLTCNNRVHTVEVKIKLILVALERSSEALHCKNGMAIPFNDKLCLTVAMCFLFYGLQLLNIVRADVCIFPKKDQRFNRTIRMFWVGANGNKNLTKMATEIPFHDIVLR